MSSIKISLPSCRFEGQSTVLRIDDVRADDEGLYKCEIAVQNSPKVYVELKVGEEDPASAGGANGARTWPSSGSAATMAAMSSSLSALLILCFI